MWQSIAEQIASELDCDFSILERTTIRGGFNQCYLLRDHSLSLFIKLNERSYIESFELEAGALRQLGATQTLRVPNPICSGMTKTHSFLAMEYIELQPATPESWYRAGTQLAALHSIQEQEMFGADEDNYIGSTPQPNSWHKKWAHFFAEQRIGWQLQLLAEKTIHFGDIDQLVEKVAHQLANHNPLPSLLHGDLWSGNIGFHDDEPVVYDPASYWGDREVDIAMTELFGRPPQSFYEGYLTTFPLEPGYSSRRNIYHFYHLLNHCNMFGSSYIQQAEQCTQQILEVD